MVTRFTVPNMRAADLYAHPKELIWEGIAPHISVMQYRKRSEQKKLVIENTVDNVSVMGEALYNNNNLHIECQRIWNKKVGVIPVIIAGCQA